MCCAVTEHGAHLGIALDGDADRLIMADESGQIIDGDQIMGLIAASWAEAGSAAWQDTDHYCHEQSWAGELSRRHWRFHAPDQGR